MSNARENILNRLRRNSIVDTPPIQRQLNLPAWSQEECIQRFIERQEAVHGEVYRLKADEWAHWLQQELPQRGVKQLLLGKHELEKQLQQGLPETLQSNRYDRDIEQWKPELFNRMDAGLTDCRCAIAETGSLVLWPDSEQPRLMSLVPPMHIVLLRAETLYRTFAEVIEKQQWASGMPTNALLISGPSKTADIEQTLAYGIHGPKTLITLILE